MYIRGVGLTTSLGWDADTSCSFARAGLSMQRPYDYFESVAATSALSEPIHVHQISCLTEGFGLVARLILMMRKALDDLFVTIPMDKVDTNCPIVIFVNDYFYQAVAYVIDIEGETIFKKNEIDVTECEGRQDFLNEIQFRFKLLIEEYSISSNNLKIMPGNTVDFFQYLDDVQAKFNGNKLNEIIIGGVNSFLDHSTLEQLLELNLIKSDDNPKGFIPGEAACVLYLDNEVSIRSYPEIANVSSHTSESTYFSYSDDNENPLIHSLGNTLKDCKSDLVILSVGNLSGCDFRAKNYYNALISLKVNGKNIYQRDTSVVEHFGEMGVISSIVAIIYSVRAFSRNYADGNEALIWNLDDSGAAGSCIVRV